MRLATALLFALCAGGALLGDTTATTTAGGIFEQRILPIFRSEKPSSCIECHLSGVDLKNYILPSSEDTFLSLRDQGMVDLDRPADSKILRLIAMRPEDGTGASLIHERNRKAELAAFAAWIEACCKDRTLREAPALAPERLALPERPNEVIRHNRIDRVVDSFARTVWALRFRCAGCHMPGGAKFAKHREKHGDKMAWLLRAGPEASMRKVVEHGLVDLDHPERSLLLLKPLNEVEHGGGKKMFPGDTDYMAFLGWIRDYARASRDGYVSAGALPRPSPWTGSELWLRIEHAPEAWLGRYGILAVHARDPASGEWLEEPVAVSSFLARKHRRFGPFAQGYLMVRSPEANGARLPQGEYRVVVHVGGPERMTTDFEEAIAAARPAASAVVSTEWARGFRHATVVPGATLEIRRTSRF